MNISRYFRDTIAKALGVGRWALGGVGVGVGTFIEFWPPFPSPYTYVSLLCVRTGLGRGGGGAGEKKQGKALNFGPRAFPLVVCH